LRKYTKLNGIDNSLQNVSKIIHASLDSLSIDLNKKALEKEDIGKIATVIGVQMSPF